MAPSTIVTTAPTTRDRKSELPKSTSTSPITASTTAKSVVHGRATIPIAAITIPAAVTAIAWGVPRSGSNGSDGRTAPSRTAAIGGTPVASRAGYMPARTVTPTPTIIE